MNKTELVSEIAKQAGLAKTVSKKALDAFEAVVTDALAKGESVALIGFGTFSVVKRAARQGVNPATGKPLQIKAKTVARFKAGARLVEKVK
ncbi:MAG: HU family DNA-binding protein [Prevotellaceae bacterium]|jgi:DNA-binding protein HU-beta|nr:HU family DNA-binding protein [Prevotellaceae bacterium]